MVNDCEVLSKRSPKPTIIVPVTTIFLVSKLSAKKPTRGAKMPISTPLRPPAKEI